MVYALDNFEEIKSNDELQDINGGISFGVAVLCVVAVIAVVYVVAVAAGAAYEYFTGK